MMMMMMSVGLPPNGGGYNIPQQPRRKATPPPSLADYTTVINAADKLALGGNNDGKLDAKELASSINHTTQLTNYYRNMFEATGNIEYKLTADKANQLLVAAQNMYKDYATFVKADPTVKGGITPKGITNLAKKDGDPTSISYRDVGLQFPGEPFPAPKDLTYLQAKEGVADAWDGKKFAESVTKRIELLDTNGDKQISYGEAAAAKDGLLGNGQLNFKPGTPEFNNYWAGISGNDGKVNARELAATMLAVDADLDGTITNKESIAFGSELGQRATGRNSAARMYDYINEKGKRFGLDGFIAETQETKDVRTTATVSKEVEKIALQNNNMGISKTIEELTSKLKGLAPNSAEAKELKNLIGSVQISFAQNRESLILNNLKEGYPEDPAGFTAGGKEYKAQLTTKVTELKTALAKLDANSAQAKSLQNAIGQLENLAAVVDFPRSFGSSNLPAETRLRKANELILGKQLLSNLDPASPAAIQLKKQIEAEIDAFEYLPKADVSKLSAEGKALFMAGEDYMATAKQLQMADVNTPAGKALQTKLEGLEKTFLEASNLKPIKATEPVPPPVAPPITAKVATQTLIDNFGDFEALLDGNKNNKDGVAHFNELLEYMKKADGKPEVRKAIQFFIDNRATTFDVMESISDSQQGRKDGLFGIDELRKFLALQK